MRWQVWLTNVHIGVCAQYRLHLLLLSREELPTTNRVFLQGLHKGWL